MAASSIEELKGRIAAGEYAVSSGELADDIVAKFALVRRVSRAMRDDQAAAGGQRRSRGPSQPSPSRQRRSGVS